MNVVTTHRNKGTPMNWTDERVEILKMLWADGLSASNIAAQLGGITRNAVIGKVHRLGLTSHPKPATKGPARIRDSKPRRELREPTVSKNRILAAHLKTTNTVVVRKRRYEEAPSTPRVDFSSKYGPPPLLNSKQRRERGIIDADSLSHMPRPGDGITQEDILFLERHLYAERA